MKLVTDNDVVISGIGGKFAKANNLEEFKEALMKNEILLGTRWNENEFGVSNALGTNEGIEYFDTSYFGIHREQCNYMDPMQRHVMERTFEALIDAGVSPAEIRGKRVAVYTGSSVGENDNLFYESIVSGFGVTGHSRSMMSNRVSYWLNLKGPSCAYDNNWLNGIEVLHAAYDAISQGHCDSAIVATANLSLHAEISWLYNEMGLISPDGQTRPFDADANGYARADGVIVLYIQRACEAKRSYATIVGINAHYNGDRDGTFRDINPGAMQDFIQDFYNDLKIDPKDVEFVESYGCGIKQIDEAEMEALEKVYCKDRLNPLLVGSVKPNTGHAEASSIFVSLAKVLIAMESGVIPATVNHKNPNPNIASLKNGKIEIVTENRPWSSGLAAINGLGVSSSYGHILLRGNPKVKHTASDELPRLIPISTRTEEGIQAILNYLKPLPELDHEYAALIQDTFKQGITGHLYRGYAVLDGTEDSKTEFEFYPGNKRPIWFVFSGMGSQWCKMACDLMKLPIFADSIHKCHKILEPKGVDLLRIITEDDEKMFDNILHSFVGIAAMQIALTDVLFSLNIRPDGIIGHSVGELGCAYADGCLTAEQMILSAYSRGKASLDATLIKGMMAAVGMGYNQIKDQCPPTIEVACHNGPDSSTISGPAEDMEVFVNELKEKGTFARLVNVADIAYHSQYIQPAGPLLLKYLKEVIPNPLPRTSKWVSTSIPEENWESDLAKTSSAEYHTNNLLSSVLFEEGSKHIPKEAVLIEIAPHGLLQAILKRSIKGNCTNIPLTQKSNKNGLNFLLGALGKLYLTGVNFDVRALYPRIQYPVSRGTRTLTPLIHWEHGEKWRSGLEDKHNFATNVMTVNISLRSEEFAELMNHQIKNTVIIPASLYLGYVYEILANALVNPKTDVIFENLHFLKILNAPKHGTTSLYLMIQRGSGHFEVSRGEDLILTGTLRTPETEKLFADAPKIENTESAVELSSSDVYNEFYHRGHKYNREYKCVKTLTLTKQGSISKIQWSNKWTYFLEAMLQQALFHKGERHQSALSVDTIQKISISPEALPSESTDLEVHYNYSTEILSTDGIQIIGVTAKPSTLDDKLTTFECVELTPLSKKIYNKMESVITVGLQIVLNNFDQSSDSIIIVEIETSNSSLKPHIQNVVNKYKNINANLSIVDDSKKILVPQTESLFVLLNSTINDDCIKLLLSSHAFLLVHTDTKLLSCHEITQVAQFSCNGISYSLVRKATDIEPIIINIKSDTVTFKDLSRDSLSWVNSFKTAINTVAGRRVYLSSPITPTEGILNFVQDVQALDNTTNVRFVFTLDKKTAEFNIKDSLYQKIIKNDLKLNVIKDGQLHGYISTPVELHDAVTSDVSQNTSNVVDGLRIECLGINAFDETVVLNNPGFVHKLGNIDYAGRTKDGKVVAGLARLDEEYARLVPDPILHWEIPERWSIEDGATFAHAYTTGYYAMIHIGRLQPHENVLVHNGASAIGLACLCIANSMGCQVYTTVTSHTQKAFLKKMFRFLGDHNIFSACDTSFEAGLMTATGSIGAHLTVNTLSGTLLQATVRCVAEFGKVLQLGKLDIDQNNHIGMSVFLKNASFFGVTPEHVLNTTPEIKIKLRDLVQHGIEKVVVRPLNRIVSSHQNIDSILRDLKKVDHIGKIVVPLSNSLAIDKLYVNKAAHYICDPKNSYLIYGGSAEIWTDVVEWLVFRGARKIVVSSDSKAQQTHINRRLTLLQQYFDVKIIVTSTKPQTRDSALELLSEANLLGPIGIVFVLPSKTANLKTSEVKAVQYLDLALRNITPKGLLVNFLASAEGVCKTRSDSKHSTSHIQFSNNLEFSQVLQNLDNIFKNKISHVSINDNQLTDDIAETSQSLYKKLIYLLPKSIDKIKEEIGLASAKPDFIQLPSLCPRVVRDVPPLFVVPGLFGRQAVKDLSSQLLHPVYCANYPSTHIDLHKIATELAEKITNIYPRGPYNVIGISYGGPLAIEIIKILEQDPKNQCQIFLIDGAPDTVQGIIKHLGEGTNREIGLLCRILNLTNPLIVKGLSGIKDWNSRVEYVLQHFESTPEEKVFLRDALTLFKNHLENVAEYQPVGQSIKGVVHLLRPFTASKDDVCGLDKYFTRNAEVSLVNGNHLTIVHQLALANIINSKVLCDP